jgi:anaerobic selenocysteine-containing dehydrogenase
MTTQHIYGICPHDCPDSCGFITDVQDGTAVAVRPDKAHAITQGWLCVKVRNYLDHVYHPDRLTHPLRRAGPKGSGQWQRLSWAEAMAEIGERWRGIIHQYGAEAILPYSYSGTLGMVQNGVVAGRFWNRLGASQLERAICCEAAVTAVHHTLGQRLSPPYEHVLHSKLVVVWGSNPVSTAPHFMPFLRQAQRAGARLIVIDPRRTRTAKGADWHLAPLPGTDGALALGMGHVIAREGWHDEAWLAAHTEGWPALRERLADYPPERVATITGLAAADIEELARQYTTQTPSTIKFSDGLQRHQNGGQTIRAILTLPALTGQYGRLGGGVYYSTSGAINWDSETIHKWSECPPPGRIVNMNRLGKALLGEVSSPPIQSLYVFNANPAAVNPNAGKVIEGLKREDLFTVVHELYMTDTADYADIVLPATSQLEQLDLHKAYGHTLLGLNQPAIQPLGECKSNWQVIKLLAETMGFVEPWLQEDEEQIISDLLANSVGRNPELEGITLERLRADGAIPMTMPAEPPFAGGVFPTASGKVMLDSPGMATEGVDTLPQYVPVFDDSRPQNANGQFRADRSMTLITGAAHHFVTSTFANHDDLRGRESPPFVEIHPEDASARHIEDGVDVIVENKRGWCRLTARVTETVRPGVLASPKGQWLKHNDGRNVNFTTPDTLGDVAGQSTYHSNRVWIRTAGP